MFGSQLIEVLQKYLCILLLVICAREDFPSDYCSALTLDIFVAEMNIDAVVALLDYFLDLFFVKVNLVALQV